MTSDANPESKPTRRRKGKHASIPVNREDIAEEVASLATERDFRAEARLQANEHKQQIERDDAEHTRQIERDDAAHRRWKESAILVSGLVLAVAVCVSCLVDH